MMLLLVACESNVGKLGIYPEEPEIEYEAFPSEQLTLMAANGDAKAQLELGTRLCCGNEKEHDNKLGYTLICEAAKKGDTDAQYLLGEIHQQGVSFALSPYTLEPFLLPQDDAMAYMWYSIAAEKDHEEAKDAKEDLHEELTIHQLNRAIAGRKLWRRTSCTEFGVTGTASYSLDVLEGEESNTEAQ